MYICICKAITEDQIQDAVDNGARSVLDLNAALGVGGGCGTCVDIAGQILEENGVETVTVPGPCCQSPPSNAPGGQFLN